MGVMARAQMMKELIPGLNAIFSQEYKQYENEHEAFYDKDTSDRSFEEELKIAGLGAAPVKAEGQSIQYDQGQEAYNVIYRHETVGLAFSLTEEAVEDNLYASLSKRYSKMLARSMAYTKQVKAAFLLNVAYTSTSYAAGDGGAICDVHATVLGGSNTNEFTDATDLSEASLEQATINMSKFVDERGLLIAVQPRKLIIPVDLQFEACRILDSQLRVGTADNDISAIYHNSTIPEGYAVNHYLTDADNWFLFNDIPDGFKHFVRVPLQTGMDGDFNTGNVRYKARERYSFGVSDFLQVYGSGD